MIKCQKGMTLIEVLVAMVLLLILASGFVWAFGVNYTLLSGGREVTSDTFAFQEMIENEILVHKLSAMEEGYAGGDVEIEVTFTSSNGPVIREVLGESIELDGTDVRYFYTFVSDTQIVTPPAPVIPGVTLRAYNPGDLSTETFPWTGSIIKAFEHQYSESESRDPLILGTIYRWYRSKSSSAQNPGYPGDYDKIIELVDDGSGTVVGDTLSEVHTSDHGRYVYFGITPFSPMGKIGREARNEERILIADPPDNLYWKDLIENAYLGNLHRLTDEAIFVETMLNNQELTLNVEINRNDLIPPGIPDGAYVFNTIPTTYHSGNFTMDIELKMDDMVDENDNYGFGIFLGDLDLTTNPDNGYMVEFRVADEKIYLKGINSGNYFGSSHDADMDELDNIDFILDWDERYIVRLIVKRSNNTLGIQLVDIGSGSESEIITFSSVSPLITKYLGFKTWSNYKYKDIDPYGLYGRLFTTHFYDVDFLSLQTHPWDYRKKIKIKGEAGAGTDFQVLLKVGESSGAAGDDFHLEGNAESFPTGKNVGGDINFTAADETTELKFWVEKIEGNSPNRTAYIWVKVTADLGSNQDIYICYGDSEALNKSSIVDTFIFADDFDGASLDLDKWNKRRELGSITQVDGYLVCGGGTTSGGYGHTVLDSKSVFDLRTFVLEGSIFLSANAIAEFGVRGGLDNTGYKGRADQRISEGLSFLKPPYLSWGFLTDGGKTGTRITALNWLPFKMTVYDDGTTCYMTIVCDGQNKSSTDTLYATQSGRISLQNHFGSYARFDDIRVRKYVATEPSFLSVE